MPDKYKGIIFIKIVFLSKDVKYNYEGTIIVSLPVIKREKNNQHSISASRLQTALHTVQYTLQLHCTRLLHSAQMDMVIQVHYQELLSNIMLIVFYVMHTQLLMHSYNSNVHINVFIRQTYFTTTISKACDIV